MRLLLDTHVFLWVVTGNTRLKPAARELISDAEAVYVSAASIWEIAINARLGKIEANPEALVTAIDSSGLLELPVTAEHAAAVGRLPLHHSDPFDRLLLAQAFSVPLKFLTADSALATYGPGVEVLD
ncbi:MAG: type II toxin-antitoxin system VapC family toxin [Proteobacteria bacterium]|nr:type II toxin-antitoxin system VapC family toxin [Pseudomonadota bacterium]